MSEISETKKIQCDNCRFTQDLKLYKNTSYSGFPRWEHPNSWGSIFRWDRNGTNSKDHLDLCPECTKRIYKSLNRNIE